MGTTIEQAAQAVLDFGNEMNNIHQFDSVALYTRLIEEESEELDEAESLAEVWKESADLLFVVLGKILAKGVTPAQLQMAFNRVVESNKSKVSWTANEVDEWISSIGLHAYTQQTPTGKFIARDATGKALKGPNYQPVVFTEQDVINFTNLK
jgi:phosphoribosyl-ATP pyrophosphohydrolase